MKKILITWGLWFIWSHFIIEAVKKWFKVINLDNETYAANRQNVNKVESDNNYTFVKWDICDDKLVKELFKEECFDIIVNFAAESHVDKSIENPDIFIKTNVLWTNILLRNALEFKVKNFIQISTDEVYWHLELWDPWFKENTPLDPRSPYSASKASSDLIALSYKETYWLNVIITRCSNNFWPHQDSSKFIPVVVKKALINEAIPIYWNWENIRDWIYVSDHISWIFSALEKWQSWEIYNFWWNKELSNLDLCKKILSILWKNENLISFTEDRKWHDFRYAINDEKSQAILWWKRQWVFDENLTKTVEYLKSNFEQL